MDLKISLAILGGFVIGVAFVYVRLRSGLSAQEWLYFKDFLDALRHGAYKEIADEEGSEENDED